MSERLSRPPRPPDCCAWAAAATWANLEMLFFGVVGGDAAAPSHTALRVSLV